MLNSSESNSLPSESDGKATAKIRANTGRLKIPLLIFVVTAIVSGIWFLGEELTLKKLASREAEFRQFQANHPALVFVAAFSVYATVAGLSLPVTSAMTLFFAWLFGFWPGMLVVSFGSTAGATIAFLLSRYLLRDAVSRRFGDRLKAFNESLTKEGPFYLFTLRLIPAVPFFVINAVMGLTSLRARTFWWVSQLGMLPGTAVYVYAGASVPALQTLADQGLRAIFTPRQLTQILMALVLLGTSPLLVRLLIRRFSRPAVRP
ncbi:MAG: TVP38/TMEM64 family protein [Planctomycetaceae bacterium]|nr:TVP38/TMEM64 family protein [Planctomycetaceae bacterium]